MTEIRNRISKAFFRNPSQQTSSLAYIGVRRSRHVRRERVRLRDAFTAESAGYFIRQLDCGSRLSASDIDSMMPFAAGFGGQSKCVCDIRDRCEVAAGAFMDRNRFGLHELLGKSPWSHVWPTHRSYNAKRPKDEHAHVAFLRYVFKQPLRQHLGKSVLAKRIKSLVLRDGPIDFAINRR